MQANVNLDRLIRRAGIQVVGAPLPHRARLLHIHPNYGLPPWHGGSINHYAFYVIEYGAKHSKHVVLAMRDDTSHSLSGLNATYIRCPRPSSPGLGVRIIRAVSRRLFDAQRQALRPSYDPLFAQTLLAVSRLCRPGIVMVWGSGRALQFVREAFPESVLVLSQHNHSYYLEADVLDCLDALILLTESSLDYMRQHTEYISPRLFVVPNGVDPDRYRPATAEERAVLKRRLGVPDNAPLILLTARPAPQKGLHIILDAWREVRAKTGATLGIVGMTYRASQKGYEHRHRERAERLDGVYWLGFKPQAEMPNVVRAADVLVMPSLWEEGLGLGWQEALAAEVPCIVSRRGGMGHCFPSDCGIVIDRPNFVEDWVAAILYMLEDKDFARKCGQGGREHILEKFTLELMAENYEKVYQQLEYSHALDVVR